jgi:hypothetical protein
MHDYTPKFLDTILIVTHRRARMDDFGHLKPVEELVAEKR